MPLPQEYISPADVAKLLGVTRTTVYNWIRSGNLFSVKIGNTIRILRSDLDNYGDEYLASARAKRNA